MGASAPTHPNHSNPVPYTVNITETNFTSVTFDTKDEAQDFIEEPDYGCLKWTPVSSKFDLVENPE